MNPAEITYVVVASPIPLSRLRLSILALVSNDRAGATEYTFFLSDLSSAQFLSGTERREKLYPFERLLLFRRGVMGHSKIMSGL